MSPLPSSSESPRTPKRTPGSETEDVLRVHWDDGLLDRFEARQAPESLSASDQPMLSDEERNAREGIFSLPLTSYHHALLEEDSDRQFKGELLFLGGLILGALWYGFLEGASFTFIAVLIALGFIGVALYELWRMRTLRQNERAGAFTRYVGPLVITDEGLVNEARDHKYVIDMRGTTRAIRPPADRPLPPGLAWGSVDYLDYTVLEIRDEAEHRVYVVPGT